MKLGLPLELIDILPLVAPVVTKPPPMHRSAGWRQKRRRRLARQMGKHAKKN